MERRPQGVAGITGIDRPERQMAIKRICWAASAYGTAVGELHQINHRILKEILPEDMEWRYEFHKRITQVTVTEYEDRAEGMTFGWFNTRDPHSSYKNRYLGEYDGRRNARDCDGMETPRTGCNG